MAPDGTISAAYVADLERRLAEAETRLAQVEEARDRLERMVKQARPASTLVA